MVPWYQCYSASTLTVVRYDSEYVGRYTYMCTNIYIYTYTCRCSRSRPSPCSRICRYPRCVLQRNSANHSRAYSDACHNERRATFCFGPVGRKYRPFWIFNFQRSSKPLRGPLLPRRFLSPFLLLPVPRCPAAFPLVLSRAYERAYYRTGVSSSRNFKKDLEFLEKIDIKVGQTLVEKWREHSMFLAKILRQSGGNSLRDIRWRISLCATRLPPPRPSHPTYERFLLPWISYFSLLIPLTPAQESISRMDDFYGRWRRYGR